MKRIEIIADTTQDFTYELADRFGVQLLSYYIEMDGKYYKDLEDINSKEFYKVMQNYEQLSTGVPPVKDVTDLLDELKSEGVEDVICITSSSTVTGMTALYHTVKQSYEGLNIHIYETKHIGATAALMTIRAAELRDAGKSIEEIFKELHRVNDQTKIYAIFRTLSYVVKGGRFNKYKGMIGNFLKITPLLSQDDSGAVVPLEKIRGEVKSLKVFIEAIRKEVGESKKYRLIIFSGDNEREKEILKENIKDLIEKADLFFETELTPVLGVHGGPGAIGCGIMKLD
ncbi:EDD domain protein, DegV family [Peptoniphilus sp. ING2-D1G]|nr:EDD domain protein, DegV family [Peptoniphilus sp. ING2-D1G]